MTLPPYPDAPRADLVEIIHGHEIADPYRWLEDSGSPETKTWLAAQADLYASYAASLPGLARLTDRLGELLGAGDIGPPTWRGGREFFLRREPGQELAVLYTVSPAGGERALIDPTMIDPTGATTLDRWEPDHDGRLVAYQLSEGGREESVLRVLDASTGADVDGPIDRCRYSDVAWLPGGMMRERIRSLRMIDPGITDTGKNMIGGPGDTEQPMGITHRILPAPAAPLRRRHAEMVPIGGQTLPVDPSSLRNSSVAPTVEKAATPPLQPLRRRCVINFVTHAIAAGDDGIN